MTLKMSKNDKALFYYLGLTLLVLIVLGAVFGISSVKESFGKKNKNKWKNRWKQIQCCVKDAGINPKDKSRINTRKDWCRTDIIKNGGRYSC